MDVEAHLSGKMPFSRSGNRLLADTVIKIGGIEAFGSGLPRVKTRCDDAGISFEPKQVPHGTIAVFGRPNGEQCIERDPFAVEQGYVASIRGWSLEETRDSFSQAEAEHGEKLTKPEDEVLSIIANKKYVPQEEVARALTPLGLLWQTTYQSLRQKTV